MSEFQHMALRFRIAVKRSMIVIIWFLRILAVTHTYWNDDG